MLTDAQESLVLQYIHETEIIAKNLAIIHNVAKDDLLGPAHEGLMRAASLVDSSYTEAETGRFIKKVIRNEIKDYLRGEHKHRGSSVAIEDVVQITDSSENLLILQDHLRKQIMTMPAKYRDTFLLKMEDPDITVAEIALYLNITVTGVQNNLEEGRKYLKNNH